MKFRTLFPIIGGSLLLSQCGPESMLSPVSEVPVQEITPVGAETSFVRDLRGSRMEYKDNHGEYYYRLSKLGTYEQLVVAPRGSKNKEQRRGLYTYKQTGKKTGEIVFDLTDVWKLKFVSPHRAEARNDGDKRTYLFEFEWQ